MRYLSGAILVMAFLFALLPCEAKAIEATHLRGDRVYQDTNNEIVTIDGVNLEGLAGVVGLRLRRVSLTDDNTIIHVFDGSSESEVINDKLLAYVGEIVNRPSSKAVITIKGRNEIDGYVEDGNIKWRLSGRYGSRIRQTDVLLNSKAQQDNPSMGLDSDIEYPVEDDRVRLFNTTKESSGEQLPSGRLYQAKIAIDVDGELFNMLGGMEKTVSYVTTLLGYVSSIYSKEIGMRFVVSDLYIWKDPALDPWTYDNAKDALVEYKNYWEQNRVSVIRSLSHLLSGRRIGGGRAYYNGLCSTKNGYGVSGDLWGYVQYGGSFNTWDVSVIAHEIGHNIGSKHTHDYHDIGGDYRPIDECNYGGPTGPYTTGVLPGINSLIGGLPGQGSGTIMSYCHTLSGGMSNVVNKFGLGHPYGIKAYRVVDLLNAKIESVAAAYPTCLSAVNALYDIVVATSGYGIGTVVSEPTGINCSAQCTATFPAGTNIKLTALADNQSVFSGWDGECSSVSENVCSFKADSGKSIIARFEPGRRLVAQTTGVGKVWSTPSGIDCGSTCEYRYTNGASITLYAEPGSGYLFEGWGGSCSGSGTCIVTMTADKIVSAKFTKRRTLTVTSRGQGTITSLPAGIDCGALCSANFAERTSVTLTQRAHDGYTFSGWGEACSGVGVCVASMDADKLVTANFTELPKYPVSVKRPTTGVISSHPAGILCGGINKQCSSDFSYASLTAEPNEGYAFSNWVGCTSPAGNVCKITPTEKMTLRAIFMKVPKYEMKVTKNTLGSVGVDHPGFICPEKKKICSVKLYKGTSVRLTATPQLGHTFVGWGGQCSSAGIRECVLIMDGKKSIQATFQ